MDAEVRRLEKKVALGATFAMTQPPSSLDMLRELHRQTREIPVEVFVGVIPFVSHRNVEFLHNEVPGIKVAEDARRRMREASDPIREGVEIAKEYMDAAIEAGFRGIYIIPMLGKYEMAYELVSHVRKP
jgi:homocysteine S-methyltransferase